MPELPEVETVVRDLRPQLSGRRIVAVELGRDPAALARVIRYPAPRAFGRRLRGQTIAAVERRGKYIVMPLGQNGRRFIVHLGMTGHLRAWEPEEAPVKHTHFRARLDSGLELRYDDSRQFGRLLLGTHEELVAARAFPARLGPEPIHGDLTEAEFERLVRARRRPVKSALLDQSFLAGVGNIYADEACFRAGIRPSRWTHRLTVRERRALYASIQEVLENSIAARGSSIINYVDAFGLRGGNQEKLLVYGRGGEPCLRCGTPLQATRLAGRGTVYCRKCQR
ncbi:MAG: bifunctional DNA-formamidopyrimidine glycosylase/DNA-(apurinic or apyrimidinic site) lyase [Chloroflexi bacterium]|nr:MAG: bifunctional DNA-formamidopyrimidine glycosylase/DNA-(apurinic or apyrimidinic site) lyase [Chloroflexota bacterium]TME45813.1 MAG: bifunctional DNA-formamidopyrimidine glycosylase/DNA-(apurinic or apyrimidinic site) lyase [Chloroflexota bacterium]